MRLGLTPYAPPVVSSGNTETGNEIIGWPYLCFALEPSTAWGLSGDMDYVTEIDEWDLWQVRFNSDDEIHYRSEFGDEIKELRVFGAIPPQRLWWVATRTGLSAQEKPAAAPRRKSTRKTPPRGKK
jgi:hypothetical protein